MAPPPRRGSPTPSPASRAPTSAARGIDRVAADELLLARSAQVLPARHPHHLAGRHVVGKRRLAQELGQEAEAGGAVEMVAEVAPRLAARVAEAVRPLR